MAGKWINIQAADGGTFKGYLALPKSGRGPGLIVIQEIFGVNHHIRAVADSYAEQGYVVLAPDMFWRIQPGFECGYGPDDMTKAFAEVQKYNTDQGVHDLGDAIKSLKALPECTGKVGVVGYCFGGKMSYLAAARLGVDAAVGYYGGGIDGYLSEAGNVKCPLILHFGELDKHITPEVVAKIKQAFAGNSHVQIYTYAGADHGFNCTERASYNPEAAKLALTRSLELFKKALG
jgi:carboxymethylenebutenolidase